MKYVVTGGAGFIGKNIVKLLINQNHEVEVVDNLHSGKISNLEEVKARGGKLYIFADKKAGFKNDDISQVFEIDAPMNPVAPILFTIPLQLLAYHCAIIKGTNVDMPRNLAKSVTVE